MLLINLAQSDIFNYPPGHHSTQTLLLHNHQQSLYFEKKDRYLNRYLGHIKDDFLVIKICKIYIQCQFNTFLSLSLPPPFSSIIYVVVGKRENKTARAEENCLAIHFVYILLYYAGMWLDTKAFCCWWLWWYVLSGRLVP